ncbi:hypothetical protein OG339_03745 [Streptosporangium sp. NBC_01495]|uniref:hypothetical protein n=1 Tax=Streptosporangium sp. NBC_01495 TaxID=2903899 RepID=UPI002E369418|nr:hypothetical protein [Streptosporangium sp. NBC_01495]
MSAAMAGIVSLKRPSPNGVIVLAMVVTPFLVAAMVWRPWPTAAALFALCGLVLVRHPWRGGPLMAGQGATGRLALHDMTQVTTGLIILAVCANTHNDYLRLAAESGIVSASLLILLICRAVRRAAGAHEHILAGVVTAYAVVLLFGNTLSNLMASTQFWVCLGTLLGTRHLEAARVTAHRTAPRTTHGT